MVTLGRLPESTPQNTPSRPQEHFRTTDIEHSEDTVRITRGHFWSAPRMPSNSPRTPRKHLQSILRMAREHA
eukprot:14287382-Alexandrium_andersonii.AAC.1